jgi:hypothetical protein
MSRKVLLARKRVAGGRAVNSGRPGNEREGGETAGRTRIARQGRIFLRRFLPRAFPFCFSLELGLGDRGHGEIYPVFGCPHGLLPPGLALWGEEMAKPRRTTGGMNGSCFAF